MNSTCTAFSQGWTSVERIYIWTAELFFLLHIKHMAIWIEYNFPILIFQRCSNHMHCQHLNLFAGWRFGLFDPWLHGPRATRDYSERSEIWSWPCLHYLSRSCSEPSWRSFLGCTLLCHATGESSKHLKLIFFVVQSWWHFTTFLKTFMSTKFGKIFCLWGYKPPQPYCFEHFLKVKQS